MEPAAAWAPCEFQLENWTIEEPAAGIWAPDAGLPAEYASIDIPGTCSLQSYVPEWSGGQQLFEYNYCSSASRHAPFGSDKVKRKPHSAVTENSNKPPGNNTVARDNKRVSNDSRTNAVFDQVSVEFKDHMGLMKKKMHRCPPSLGALDECYTVPRVVAIGPYHCDRAQLRLKQAEQVKHVAAIQCIIESGNSAEELYAAVTSAADDVRCLYDKDVMAGIGYDDFRHMMFFDACFLVQYMLMESGVDIDPSLQDFLSPNRIDIHHDVMLLENQLPWQVVETVMRFRPVALEHFISGWKGSLQDRKLFHNDNLLPVAWNEDYEPPHLLGLVRYYIVGRRSGTKLRTPNTKRRSVSASAIDLTEIGIKLTANKTMELIDMRLNQECILFSTKLYLAPLSLDRDRASYLVNMAALELRTVKSFSKAPVEDSAVCSYLMLLAMLVYREEDVHELREKGLLQGGGGLTNKEVLHFFSSLQGLRLGPCYTSIMQQIESYREKKWFKVWLCKSWNKHKKTIATVVSGIGAVATIIGTLVGILVKLKSLKAGP